MNPRVHLITIRKVRKTAAGEVSGRRTSLTIILIVELFCVWLHLLYVIICLALSLLQIDLFQITADLWIFHRKGKDSSCFWLLNRCFVDEVINHHQTENFARNTIDCLKYVRQLREKNILIIFEEENINTLEVNGELLLIIIASLVQQESQSLSQNVKLGLQFWYQNGQVQVNHNHFLGYTKD